MKSRHLMKRRLTECLYFCPQKSKINLGILEADLFVF
jgi:hypothetical protein